MYFFTILKKDSSGKLYWSKPFLPYHDDSTTLAYRYLNTPSDVLRASEDPNQVYEGNIFMLGNAVWVSTSQDISETDIRVLGNFSDDETIDISPEGTLEIENWLLCHPSYKTVDLVSTNVRIKENSNSLQCDQVQSIETREVIYTSANAWGIKVIVPESTPFGTVNREKFQQLQVGDREFPHGTFWYICRKYEPENHIIIKFSQIEVN